MAHSFTHLFKASCGAHAADQTALAALPVTAIVVIGADARTVGLLVAAQGAAWLVGTLPAGLLVDRVSRRRLLVASQIVGAAGLALATLAALAGSVALLGAAAFFAAIGTVVFVLTMNALVPAFAERAQLGAANARIELARALATLGAPVLVGVLAEYASPAAAYALAGLAALSAASYARKLPASVFSHAPPASRRSLPAELREGGAFVLGQPLLRAIVLCAVFWNMAFFAAIAVFVPYALGIVRLDPAGVGLSQAGYGAGLLLGAMAAPAVLRTLGPNVMLLAGPGLSVAAPLAFLAASHFDTNAAIGMVCLFAGQFMLGFGPMLWLICQTSIRQIVTPARLLGRVSATVQLAIYGVRPIGAVLGGWVAARFGLDIAIMLVAAIFTLSFAVVAASALARLRTMPMPVVERWGES